MKVLTYKFTVTVPDDFDEELLMQGLETYRDHLIEDVQERSECPTCDARIEVLP
jgi:hypothetical protein